MTIANDIDQQIEFLQRPETVWVRRCPSYPNEACAIARVSYNFSASCRCRTIEFLNNCLPTKEYSIMHWNDHADNVTKEDVIQILEKARARAWEEGV